MPKPRMIPPDATRPELVAFLKARQHDTAGKAEDLRRTVESLVAPLDEARPPMTYTREGVPLPESANRFSYLAWQCTRGLNPDRDRIGAKELALILEQEHGIIDPERSSWQVQLRNGIVVGARLGATDPATKPTRQPSAAKVAHQAAKAGRPKRRARKAAA